MGCSESAPDANGHITLDAKQAGKRSAGNPHAAFDEAGAGNVTRGAGLRTNAKAVGIATGPYRRRASPRPYLGGERGKPLPASRLALVFHPETEERVVGGGALLVEMDDGCPLLDVLLVSPEWQRRGLATALVSSAIDQLHGSGYRRLTSRYMLGNDESEAWHGKFGFAAHPGRQPDWAAIVDPQPPGAGESGTGMEHGGGPLAGG